MHKVRKHGFVGDMWPHIQIMKLTGLWMFEYYEENGGAIQLMRMLYASVTTVLMLMQFAFILLFLIFDTYNGDQMASATISFLFFAHSITKYLYFAFRSRAFYRVLGSWNHINSHPLFVESNARHRTRTMQRVRRLLLIIGIGTLISVMAWTFSTFIGPSTRLMPDPDDVNRTIYVEVPRLMLGTHMFWDTSSGFNYVLTFIYQLYFLMMALTHANLLDVVFCCFVIFACEQLKHLKEILRPLMELSAALDVPVDNPERLFRRDNSNAEVPLLGADENELNNRYNNEYNPFPALHLRPGGVGPNGLSKKQEMLVRSAIKYWVERHKHVVKHVANTGDAYGSALLLHMLTSTVTLTLLAYQATKIDKIDMFSITVIGYLFYSLAQVFVFCIHGNELIEESASVMEAAYSCHWYDGSEEAKTFVQIVCQQCQKSLTVSGAKFFTVSLDLFASVLGAVVTYFMVLIQLK
nr:odorant receptor coreceptor [Nephotettix cincticeps]